MLRLINYVRLITFLFCVNIFGSQSGKMSDVDKLKKRRANVKGTVTSKLNQLKDMFEPEAAATAPGETLVLALISDVEDKIKTVEECTEAVCLELDDNLIQEEVENNSIYLLSVKTQTIIEL